MLSRVSGKNVWYSQQCQKQPKSHGKIRLVDTPDTIQGGGCLIPQAQHAIFEGRATGCQLLPPLSTTTHDDSGNVYTSACLRVL